MAKNFKPTIMRRGNIVNQHIQQTLQIVKDGTSSYIKSIAPTMTDVASGIRDTGRTVANIPNTNIVTRMRSFNIQTPFRNVNNWFNNARSDLGIESNEEKLDLDIQTDDVSVEEAQLTELEVGTNKVALATIGSAEQLSEIQKATSANIISTLDVSTNKIYTKLEDINKNMISMMEMLSVNTSKMIEMQSASMTQNAINSSSDDNIDRFGSSRFSVKDWKENIKKNIKDLNVDGIPLSMLPLLFQMGKNDPSTLVQPIIELLVDKISPNFKDNIKVIDDSFNEIIMASLARLGEQAKNYDNPFLNAIGKIFGIDASRKEVSTSVDKLELKSIPFDTVTKEAITQTIPGYLREILKTLGGQDKFYDYKDRKFKTEKDVEKEFRNIDSETMSQIFNRGSSGRKLNNQIMSDNNRQQALNQLLLNQLSGMDQGDSRQFLGSMNRNSITSLLRDVVKDTNLFGKDGKFDKDYLHWVKQLESLSPEERLEMWNSTVQYNVTRDKRLNSFLREQESFGNIQGIRNITDSVDESNRSILENSGFAPTISQQSSISDDEDQSENMTYSNNILYDIFRRLDKGINTFIVGEDKTIRDKPFKMFSHIKPPKRIVTGTQNSDFDMDTSSINNDISNSGRNENYRSLKDELDDPNLVDPETGEPLSKGKRFARWGKNSVQNLGSAILSGKPGDVRKAFFQTAGDLGTVAKDAAKTGISKVNESFGNVGGYIKHYFTGAGYEYYDTDPETGKKIKIKVGKNDKGGLIGYIGDKVLGSKGEDGKRSGGLFGKAKSAGSNIWSKVSEHFNIKGEKGDASTRRKKFIQTSVGAVLGGQFLGGIIGGPLGMIVGGLAGSAFDTSYFGARVKRFIFGEKDEEGNVVKEGILKKAFSAAGFFGRAAQNFIIKPIMGIGKSIFNAGKNIGKFIINPFIKVGSNIVKGTNMLLFGEKEMVLDPKTGEMVYTGKRTGGFLRNIFNNTFGVIGHQISETFKAGKEIVLKRILDPISDTFFVMKETVKNKASDFLLGREDPETGERKGGLFSPIMNATNSAKNFVKDKVKGFFNKSFDLMGQGIKTLVSSPFVLMRMLNPFKLDENIEDAKSSFDKVKNAKGLAKVGAFSNWFSNLGKNNKLDDSEDTLADAIAGDDTRVQDALKKRREKRAKDRNRFSQERMDQLYEDFISYFQKTEVTQEEVKDIQEESNETSAEIRDDLRVLREEGTREGSIFTHDHTVVSKLEEIIDIIKNGFGNKDDKNINTESSLELNSPQSINMSSNNSGIGIFKENEMSNESEAQSIINEKEEAEVARKYTNSIMAAASTIAAEGQLTSADSMAMDQLQEENSKKKPNKEKVSAIFDRLLKQNENSEETGEKKESFWQKLLKGIGGMFSGIFGGLGGILKWALLALGAYKLTDGKILDWIKGGINLAGDTLDFILNPQEEGSNEAAVQDAVGKQGGNIFALGNKAINIGNKIIASGADDIIKAGGPVKGLLGKIASKIPIVKKLVPTASKFDDMVNGTNSITSKLASNIDDVYSRNTGKLLDSIVNKTKSVGSSLKSGIGKYGSKVLSKADDLLTKYPKMKGFVDYVKRFPEWFKNCMGKLKGNPIVNKIDDMIAVASNKMKSIKAPDFLKKALGSGKMKFGNFVKKFGKALAVFGAVLEVYSATLRICSNSDDPQMQEYANTMINGSLLDKTMALFSSIIYMISVGPDGIDDLITILYNATITVALDILTPVGVVKMIIGLCELLFTFLGNIIGGSIGQFLLGLASGCSDLLNFATDLVAAGADLVTLTNMAIPKLIEALTTGDFSWFKKKLNSLWSNLRSSGGNAVGSLTKIIGDLGVGVGQGAANIGMRSWQGLGNVWYWTTDKLGFTDNKRSEFNTNMNQSIDNVNNTMSNAYDTVHNKADEWNNAIAGRGSKKKQFVGKGNNNKFSQNNPEYKFLGMDDNGCGPTSLALAMTKSGKPTDPAKVDMLMQSQGLLDSDGANIDDMQQAASSLGFNMEKSNNNKEKFIKQLSQGKPAVILGHGTNYDTNSDEYHYMTATNIDSKGNVIVNNPLTGTDSKVNINSLLSSTSDILYPKGKGKEENTESSSTGILTGAFKIVKDAFGKIKNYLFGDFADEITGKSNNEKKDMKQENGEHNSELFDKEPANSEKTDFKLNGASSIAPKSWEGLPDWNPDIGKEVSGSWNKRAAYAEYIAPLMRKDFDEHHILPSFKIAQSIIEGLNTSGSGKNVPEGSILTDASTNYMNLFGLDNGRIANQHIPFNNWKDNVFEHGALLNRKEGYNSIVGERNIDAAINKFDFGLYQKGISGPNPWYEDLMRQIVNKLNLTQYDEGLNWSSSSAWKDNSESTATKAVQSGQTIANDIQNKKKGKGIDNSSTENSAGNTFTEAFRILKETGDKIKNYLMGSTELEDGSAVDENAKPGDDTEKTPSDTNTNIRQSESYNTVVNGSDAAYLVEALKMPINHDFGSKVFHPNGHLGVDYPVGTGTPIPTTATGTVVSAKDNGLWGKQVIVKADSDKTIHTFNHLNEFGKTVGSRVNRGDVIGYSGATGNVTGPHLDYSIGGESTWNGSTLQITKDLINPHNISHSSDTKQNSEEEIHKKKGSGAKINNTFANIKNDDNKNNNIGGIDSTSMMQQNTTISTEKMEMLLNGILEAAEAIRKNTTPAPKGKGSSNNNSSYPSPRLNRPSPNAALPYNQTNVNSIMSLARGVF